MYSWWGGMCYYVVLILIKDLIVFDLNIID